MCSAINSCVIFEGTSCPLSIYSFIVFVYFAFGLLRYCLKTSPAETCNKFILFFIKSPCVPFPEPAAPIRTTLKNFFIFLFLYFKNSRPPKQTITITRIMTAKKAILVTRVNILLKSELFF